MKWSREKSVVNNAWKLLENLYVIFHVTPGVVDNLCVTLKQSGEVNEIRRAFTIQPKICDGAFLRK